MVNPIILNISPFTESSSISDYYNYIEGINGHQGYIDYLSRKSYVEDMGYDSNAPDPYLLTYLNVDFDYDIYDEDNKKETKHSKDNDNNNKEKENGVYYRVIDDDVDYPFNVIIGYKEDAFGIAKNVLMKPGGLVSIPTETVYGLGANIYLEESLKRIFKIKKRPLNDPLIVHVYSFDYAIKYLYDVDDVEAGLIKYLAKKFTPGPLTIVSRCKKSVPKLLTNGTGYLGVRVPNNQLCLELLKYIKVPLAAPSANKFGHISPTCPEHVFNEFRGESIYILDGGPCKIGIESTVIKIYKEENNKNKDKENGEEINNNKDNKINDEFEKNKNINNNNKDTNNNNIDNMCLVEILRKGAVTYEDLRRELEGFKNVKVYERVSRVEGMNIVESPGMLMTHYAPNVPTYMVIENRDNKINEYENEDNKDKENKQNKTFQGKENGEEIKKDINNENKINGIKNETEETQETKKIKRISIDCKNIILIDIGSRFKGYSELFKSYFQVEKDPVIVANQLYSLLRRAENICINENKEKENGEEINNDINKDNKINEEYKKNKYKYVIGIYFNEENVDLYSSIHDRLLRATSGNVVYVRKAEGGIEFVRE